MPTGHLGDEHLELVLLVGDLGAQHLLAVAQPADERALLARLGAQVALARGRPVVVVGARIELEAQRVKLFLFRLHVVQYLDAALLLALLLDAYGEHA